MGVMSFLFGERKEKALMVYLPVEIVNALDTMVYLLNQQGENGITKDELVRDALGEYLKKNLWAVKEVDAQTTQIQRIKTFESRGQAQMRKN